MTNLSDEAKILAGTFWNIMRNTKLSFDRPWAIHPKTRKGLTDLVEAGYLTEKPRNHIKDCPIDFEPTEKMKDLPRFNMEWLEANTFPLTQE